MTGLDADFTSLRQSPVDYAELLGRLSPAKQKRAFAAIKTLTERPLPDTEYATNPIGWAVTVLKIPENTIRWSLNAGYENHQWDGTPDPLVVIAEALAKGVRRVGVESATGTGKTFNNAWLALWFLVCFEDSLVVTTAPKEEQLASQLWKEIGRHWSRFSKAYPQAKKDFLRVRLKPGTAEAETWAITGWGCGVGAAEESATKAQGFHAGHMLILPEETPGINPAVMAAFRNTSVGSHNLICAVGNPDSQLDTLHQFCTRKETTHVRISAFDHPNVVMGRELIPGATTLEGIEGLREDWGEGSGMFNSRAHGISPAEAVDALIKLEWCTAAAKRWNADRDGNSRSGLRTGKMALGVDVAQSVNGDKAAIARWNGACLDSVRAFQCTNATKLGTDVYSEATRDRIDLAYIGVDSVGLGAATVNELRNKPSGYAVNALNGGSSPISNSAKASDGSTYEWVPDENLFNNLRSQMYWQMREDLRLGRVALPDNPNLFRELTMPTYLTKNGKTVVEDKLAIKKRLGNSPDMADAVVYGNWVRPREALPKQDVAESTEGRDLTVFDKPLEAFDQLYETGSGTMSQLPWGF